MFGNLSIQFYFSAQTYLMKKYIVLFLCLFTQITNGQTSFYYYNEQFRGDNAPNEILPTLKISNEEVIQKLREAVSYPRFAKSKFMSQPVLVQVSLNDSGQVTNYLVEEPGFPMFDTLAVRLAMLFENDWMPAKVNGKPIPYKLSIPFDFSTRLSVETKQLIFQTTVFTSRLRFNVDSTNSFPASVRMRDSILVKDSVTGKLKNKYLDHYVLKSMEKAVPSMSSFVGMYGTVRLGLTIDKNGKASNIQLIHPVSKTMNDKAMEDIKEIESNWIPAHENGEPVDSYKEFDFNYTIDHNTKISGWGSSRAIGYSYFYKSQNEDLVAAYTLLEKEKYEKALEKFVTVEQLLLDDIDIKFRIGMIQLFLGNSAEGCKKLNLIKSIAIDTGYPASVTEGMVDEALGKYCATE